MLGCFWQTFNAAARDNRIEVHALAFEAQVIAVLLEIGDDLARGQNSLGVGLGGKVIGHAANPANLAQLAVVGIARIEDFDESAGPVFGRAQLEIPIL